MDNEQVLAFFVKEIGKSKAKYLAKGFFERTFFDEEYDSSEAPESTLLRVYEDLEENGILEYGMEEFLEGLLDDLADEYGEVSYDAMYFLEEYEG